MSRHIVCLW